VLHLLDHVLAHSRFLLTTLSAAHSLAGDGGFRGSAGPAGEKLRFMYAVLFLFDAAVSTRIVLDSVPPREHPLDSCTLALTPRRVMRHPLDSCTLALTPSRVLRNLCTCIARPLCIDGASSCRVRALLGSCVGGSCHLQEWSLRTACRSLPSLGARTPVACASPAAASPLFGLHAAALRVCVVWQLLLYLACPHCPPLAHPSVFLAGIACAPLAARI